MNRCAFLTMESLDAFVCDDFHAVAPLEALGWKVEFVPWRIEGADWNQYRSVVIRSTWDYQKDLDSFLGVLGSIEQSQADLQNCLEIARWNARKTYLLDLEKKGVHIVPSRFYDRWKPGLVRSCFDSLRADVIVLKPVVGANADHVFRVSRTSFEPQMMVLEQTFENRPFFVQPFRSSICDEGEYSLFFFDSEYSHSILKRPADGDFRSQEEHGASIRAIDPDAELLASAEAALAVLPAHPLYARIDFVRNSEGKSELMEFELIEPSLYLRMDSDAPRRFAEAIHRRFSPTISLTAR